METKVGRGRVGDETRSRALSHVTRVQPFLFDWSLASGATITPEVFGMVETRFLLFFW